MNRGIRCPSTPRYGMRRVAVLVVALVSALISQSGNAGQVYRCGNVFQDTPCPEVKPTVDTRPAAKTAELRTSDTRPATRPAIERIQVADRETPQSVVLQPKR